MIKLSYLVTEPSFNELKDSVEKVRKEFDVPIMLQRSTEEGNLVLYSKEIEEYLNEFGVDVPINEVDSIDFYGKLCWSGMNFFYIESNGDVYRCYTHQENEDLFKLGNLSNIPEITVFDKPMPCLSSILKTCYCSKVFISEKFYTGISASSKEIEHAKNFRL